MKTERLINVVLLELSAEKLKIEDDLERINNSNKPISVKVTKIKKLITKLNEVEMSITKFNDMVSDNKNNDKK